MKYLLSFTFRATAERTLFLLGIRNYELGIRLGAPFLSSPVLSRLLQSVFCLVFSIVSFIFLTFAR